MIINAKYKNCKITFGNGKTSINTNIGKIIYVYVDNLYNNDIYELITNERYIEKTNGYFSFVAVQTKNIQIEMKHKDGTIIKSNKINLFINNE